MSNIHLPESIWDKSPRVNSRHSPEVVAAADSPLGYANTVTVAKALALTGLDLLLDEQLCSEVKEEFALAMHERSAG